MPAPLEGITEACPGEMVQNTCKRVQGGIYKSVLGGRGVVAE